MRAVGSVAALCCGLVMLMAVGCGPGPKDMQIEALQDQVNKLQAEKQDLLAKLARAISERDNALARVRDLEQQLAGGEKPKKGGIFTEFENLAWADISERVLFDSGKADLKSTGRAELQTVVSEARSRWPDREIWIVGHTDTDPIKHSHWKDNLELSVQRACTVFRELEKMGISPQNMVAAGRGEFAPKADNATSAGKAKNRRVQIIAIKMPPPNAGATEEPSERG